MVDPGRNEDRVPFAQLDRLSRDVEHPAAFEHDVHLVVGMRLLPVCLRRDEDVDADLEALGLVDDLVASAFAEPLLRVFDVEGVGDRQLHGRNSSPHELLSFDRVPHRCRSARRVRLSSRGKETS